MFMKNIRDDRWTDWLIDEEHRWENIDRVKLARRILGVFFFVTGLSDNRLNLCRAFHVSSACL